MKRIGNILGVALCIDLLSGLATCGQTRPSANSGGIGPAARVSFLADSLQDVPEEPPGNPKGSLLFRPFVSVPKGEPPLPAANYLQVCQNFAWWCRAVIKPEYVPGDSFVVAHLQLFRATAERPYDTAFLGCRKGGMQYLIVQTGGINGRLFFVTGRGDSLGLTKETDAQGAMMAAVREYVNLPHDLVLPGFDVQERGGLRCIKVGYDQTKQSILTCAQCILSSRDIALSFWKLPGLVGATAAAREPPPDGWFQWEMGKGLRLPFPDESTK